MWPSRAIRSEEHTSELQSQSNLVWLFFNDTATTEIYTLSLHDALPISVALAGGGFLHDAGDDVRMACLCGRAGRSVGRDGAVRSEEHTSELQSQSNLVCRL